jgi:hypothetical protein
LNFFTKKTKTKNVPGFYNEGQRVLWRDQIGDELKGYFFSGGKNPFWGTRIPFG